MCYKVVDKALIHFSITATSSSTIMKMLAVFNPLIIGGAVLFLSNDWSTRHDKHPEQYNFYKLLGLTMIILGISLHVAAFVIVNILKTIYKVLTKQLGMPERKSFFKTACGLLSRLGFELFSVAPIILLAVGVWGTPKWFDPILSLGGKLIIPIIEKPSGIVDRLIWTFPALANLGITLLTLIAACCIGPAIALTGVAALLVGLPPLLTRTANCAKNYFLTDGAGRRIVCPKLCFWRNNPDQSHRYSRLPDEDSVGLLVFEGATGEESGEEISEESGEEIRAQI